MYQEVRKDTRRERVREGGCDGQGIMEEAEPDVKPQLNCMYEQSQSLQCILEPSFMRNSEDVHSNSIEPARVDIALGTHLKAHTRNPKDPK
jgi:hypothetical protein